MKTIYAILISLFVASSSAFSSQDSLYVTITGDSVTIWNTGLFENCASRFAGSVVMMDSNKIVVTETDTVGPIVDCICSFDLSTTLKGLGTGHYTVDLFRQYLTVYHYSKDTTVWIGSVSFYLSNTGATTLTKRYLQSNCGGFSTVSKRSPEPGALTLNVNYPNPFNPATVIQYSIPRPNHVILKIVDILGREISTLVDEEQNQGTHFVRFEAKEPIGSGTYFYQITVGKDRFTRKMVFIH